MKLSMWMIANRLHDMDLELNIRDDAPRTLKSARRAYADNCVWVYQEGKDAVCKADEDYIIIKDMNVSAAAEILQGVFDYYDDWDYSIREDAADLNFQKIIDRSWHIFRNPMVLMDANWNVLALSSRYGEDDLDNEWKHLKKYGASSMDVYLYMRNDHLNNYNREGVQYFHMSNPALTNCISSLIIYKGIICGRINVLESDRKLNRGDIQNLEYLIHVLSLYIGRADVKADSENNTLSVMHNLLQGKIEEENLIRKRMEYIGWKDGEDTFQVLVITPRNLEQDQEIIFPLRNQLLRQLVYSDISMIDRDPVRSARSEISCARIQPACFMLQSVWIFMIYGWPDISINRPNLPSISTGSSIRMKLLPQAAIRFFGSMITPSIISFSRIRRPSC